MTRRKKSVLLVLLVTGLGGGGFATLLRPTPGVTIVNFELLGRCTSLADVECLMGCKPAEMGPAVGSSYGYRGRFTHYRTWHGDGIKIVVAFNKDDLVTHAIAWSSDGTVLGSGLREPESLLDTIKRLAYDSPL